jgi:hypothetical protein
MNINNKKILRYFAISFLFASFILLVSAHKAIIDDEDAVPHTDKDHQTS